MSDDTRVSDHPEAVKIAVVEDDAEIRDLIVGYLNREGFNAVGCADAKAFDAHRAQASPDLVVVDLMMPGEDGLSLCRRISPDFPVLILSAKGEDLDRIIGLEVGADDYLPKPFNPRELVARIRAILRRRRSTEVAPEPADAPSGETRRFAGFTLDIEARALTAPDGAPVILTSSEIALLIAFAQRPNRVLSRDQLIDFTRGPNAEPFDRAIDVQVSRLRRKLSASGGDNLIRTVRGDGYLFAGGGAARP